MQAAANPLCNRRQRFLVGSFPRSEGARRCRLGGCGGRPHTDDPMLERAGNRHGIGRRRLEKHRRGRFRRRYTTRAHGASRSRSVRSTTSGNRSTGPENDARCHPDGARIPRSHSPRVSDGARVTRQSPGRVSCRRRTRTFFRIASAIDRSDTPSISTSMSICPDDSVPRGAHPAMCPIAQAGRCGRRTVVA